MPRNQDSLIKAFCVRCRAITQHFSTKIVGMYICTQCLEKNTVNKAGGMIPLDGWQDEMEQEIENNPIDWTRESDDDGG